MWEGEFIKTVFLLLRFVMLPCTLIQNRVTGAIIPRPTPFHWAVPSCLSSTSEGGVSGQLLPVSSRYNRGQVRGHLQLYIISVSYNYCV